MSAQLEQINSNLIELMETLKQLITCLQEEKEAVVEMNLHNITESQKKKQVILRTIDLIETERKKMTQDLARQAGLPTNSRLTKILESLPQDEDTETIDSLRHNLSCVRSMAQAAQEFNESERQYLVHSLNHVQASLNLLNNLQGNGTFQGYTNQGTVDTNQSIEPRPVLNRTI